MYDVHVIGAGPAGSFAAREAALSGKKVLLCEEHGQVGSPVACSGLISKAGLELMRDVVDYRKITLNRINGAIIVAAGKRFYIESSENEKALVIDRGEFDRMAAQSAQEAGVRLKEGCHVAQGEYEANCIIGADGPNSSVARHFGFSKIREYVICAQADYEFDCEDRHKVQAYLSPSRFPGFFGWAIPNGDGTAKIGMGGRLPCDIKKRFEAFTGELGLGGKKPEKYMSAIIPISMREKTGMESSGKKVLLAGDAAGQVKATTGGGIFFGSQCGRLAGKNCENPAGYEIAWRAKYGADLQLHRHIYNSMHTLGHAGHEAFFLGAKALGAEKFLSRYGQMDLITKSFNMETVLNYIVGGNAAAQG